MPRYELVKGTSSKFWEIELSGKSFTTTYGRIGASGQSTTKKLGSPAEAARERDKLVSEKVGKGYKLVSGGAKAAKAVRKPAGKSAAVADLEARTAAALEVLEELGRASDEKAAKNAAKSAAKSAAKPAGKRAPELPEDWEDRERLDVGALGSYLAKGGDPNVRGMGERTPLMIAATGGQLPAVKMLLDAGADVNARDYGGTTPLHLAAEASATAVVELLLAHEANPHAVNQYKSTPLYEVPQIGERDKRSQSARVRIVGMLLDAGAAIEAARGTRQTPLTLAAHAGDIAVVRALLAKGANPNPKGWSAVELAVDGGFKDVERVLIAAGGRP